MTLINASLCLPELDITALSQKRSIVAMTQRFIVPDRSFALLPCRILPAEVQLSDLYHPQVLADLQPYILPVTKPMKVTHWAECTFCQPITDDEAVAAVSDRTIWTKTTLLNHLQNRGKLFLSFLKVYALPKAIPLQAEPAYDQLYKFLPLPQYLEVTHQKAVLSNDEFTATKQTFLEPADLGSASDDLPNGNKSNNNQEVNSIPAVEDILNSPDWASKISEFGNSSDGDTFEKLVRKGLVELGFSNTLNKIEKSLDPSKTGGAGGLDFYANLPYPIVGECKATQAIRVRENPVAQLHRIGFRHLSSHEYESSVKLIIAGGNITTHANETAHGHQMNVIKPETFQSLVALKIKYEDAIELFDLKAYLKLSPFGTSADAKIISWIQNREAEFKQQEQYIQQRFQIIQTIKELSSQTTQRGQTAFSSVEIRAHYNAKHQPLVTDEATEDMLKELSSPLSGYLARRHLPGDQERFYWVKDMQR